jgi:predicted metalloenzyme YecM
MSIESVIGDYALFIEMLVSQVQKAGVDVAGLELDHICVRVEDQQAYEDMCSSLVPALGHTAHECIIGGRMISTIKLRTPIQHAGRSVACIEVPAPKLGRFYRAGLEHGEFVIGGASRLSDSCTERDLLAEFMGTYPAVVFDTRALHKDLNADVGLSFQVAGKKVSAKFHVRPLYEVVDIEMEQERQKQKEQAKPDTRPV